MEQEEKDIIPFIAVAKFADSVIPVFKELKNRNYIQYGADNLYPEYLTYLFNKSAKHNAILVGKAKYIFGAGFINGDFVINRLGESLNDVAAKLILDEVVYGGWRAEIVWNRQGKIQEIYHVDYNTLRDGKEGGFYFTEEWKKWTRDEEITLIPEFDPSDPVGSQIYAYNSYRPGQRFYPLPDYIGCINYIEVDIEIGKFNLSGIRNGMNPSKMIQFFKGEPTEDKKKEIEKRMTSKFAGAENAGKFLLVFNEANGINQTVKVDDLSANDLDKMYDQLNKTCQQEIFSGHLVTSPMLFGIAEPGKLGGTMELNISYSIFQNTYSKPKAEVFSKEIEYLMSFSAFPGTYELIPTQPVDVIIDPHDVINSLPKEFVFKKLGIPEDEWDKENIGADNRPTPTTPIPPSTQIGGTPQAAQEELVNEHLKNLSAKQLMNINRIIRQYKKGQIHPDMAKSLLSNGYGLSDDDVNKFLGIKPLSLAASYEAQADQAISMFDACGESQDDFYVLKSKSVHFRSEFEMESDEEVWIKQAFKTIDVTATEAKIIGLIKKDKLITPEVIAVSIGQTPAYVQSKIDSLVQRGYIEQSEKVDGIDVLIERVVAPDIEIPPTVINKTPITQITVMYSYKVKPNIGPPIIENTRPFCRKMIELNRFYTRADIEKISTRLGYSVFDRKGGWWGDSPECRHRWVSSIVVKKVAR